MTEDLLEVNDHATKILKQRIWVVDPRDPEPIRILRLGELIIEPIRIRTLIGTTNCNLLVLTLTMARLAEAFEPLISTLCTPLKPGKCSVSIMNRSVVCSNTDPPQEPNPSADPGVG